MIATGSARKLQPNDIAEIAEQFDLTEAHLRTVIEVETSGRGFDARGRVERLFEPHIFYRQLKGQPKKLNAAIRNGTAYPKWGGPGSYPKSPELRWQQFLKAVEIDETAAIKSASWGLGQIMGSEYEECGYSSPQELLTQFAESEREQVVAMCNLIKARKLDIELRKFPNIQACRNFARRYNGAAYEKNRYHLKLQVAYNRWVLRSKSGAPMAEDGILRVASRGERVKGLQRKLNELGYECGVPDGKFGNMTRDAVLAWQADAGVPTDGTMDAKDLAALEDSPPRPIPPERAETTMADLKKESTIVQNGDLVTKGVGTITAVGAASEGANQLGLLDRAEEVSEKVERGTSIMSRVREGMEFLGLDTLMTFINEHLGLIAICGGGLVWFAVYRIKQARLRMHQKGELG